MSSDLSTLTFFYCPLPSSDAFWRFFAFAVTFVRRGAILDGVMACSAALPEVDDGPEAEVEEEKKEEAISERDFSRQDPPICSLSVFGEEEETAEDGEFEGDGFDADTDAKADGFGVSDGISAAVTARLMSETRFSAVCIPKWCCFSEVFGCGEVAFSASTLSGMH